jgi:plasmid stabilization system protein ParE
MERCVEIGQPTLENRKEWRAAYARLANSLHASLGTFPPRPAELGECECIVWNVLELESRLFDANYELNLCGLRREVVADLAHQIGRDEFRAVTIITDMIHFNPATYARFQDALRAVVHSLLDTPRARLPAEGGGELLRESNEDDFADPVLTAAQFAEQLGLPAKAVGTFLSTLRAKNPKCGRECASGNGVNGSRYVYLKSAVWSELLAFKSRRNGAEGTRKQKN